MTGGRECACCVPSQRAVNAIALACSVIAFAAHAQEIEPRQYSNAPLGVNFLVGGYAHTDGGLAFDSSLPITDPQLETNSGVLGFARALDLWGHSGKIDGGVAYTWLSGTADYLGDQVTRDVNGFGDPLIRLSVNLYGAPALQAKDFKSYKQDLIVGAALQVSVPAGQYDETRIVNIGTNRWFFRPSLGISKAAGPVDPRGDGGGHFLYGQHGVLQRQPEISGSHVWGTGARDPWLQERDVGSLRCDLLLGRQHGDQRGRKE